MADKYTIIRNGKKIFTALSESEYFDIMEDYAIEYYKTGRPTPAELETIIIGESSWQRQKTGLVKTGYTPGKPKSLRQGDGNGTNTPRRLATMHVNPTEDKGGKCIH